MSRSKPHDYEVEYALVQLLMHDEALAALVGDKIYPVYIDRDTEGDAVYYNSELQAPDETKMGVYQDNLKLYICAVGWDMDRVNRIMAAVQDALEGTYASPWMEIRAVGSQKDADDKKYYKAIEFTVKW